VAKPQLKSKAWNRIVTIGSVVLLALGFGGLFLLQSASAGATTTLLFVVFLGLLTFLFFAGPGIAFAARKRIAWVKARVPGGSLAWVRAHLYLPILALVGAWVHASVVPFRSTLSSGKVLLALGIVVSVCGVARHHLIGVTKSAINADAQISKIAVGRSRVFRQLVIDYKQLRRPLADIEADVATLPPDDQAAWAKVVETQAKVDHEFPRGGGQSATVRAYKVLRALHAPLTIVLFLALSFHVVDVLGVSNTVLADDKENIASVADCAGCHTEIADEFAQSSMAHAQVGTIMEAQLPVTLARNEELAKQLGDDQQDLFDNSAQVCINCHAPIGAREVSDPTAVLPFDEGTDESGPAVSGGGDAVNKDGVSCTTCHTMDVPPGELAGAGPLNIDGGTHTSYGTVYGPLFDDPNPLPVRVHDMAQGDDGFWDDPIATSIACGTCHNVKLDIDGDGLTAAEVVDAGNDADEDDDGDFTLNENELDITIGADGKPQLDDLVLQTTFDEWQDYVAAFDDRILPLNEDAGNDVEEPLGCIDCHMPSNPGGAEEPVVDKGPGFLPVPDRPSRSHTFIGVDYDLDPAQYAKFGLDPSIVNDIIAERKALLGSAVTLEVPDAGPVADITQTVDVVVANNLMGHVFPTGFAFARQFWLEVRAVDQDGNEVCLVDPIPGIDSPCESGFVDRPDDLVPQCDPASVAAVLGVDVATLPNGNIDFAEPVPADQCDPWLANFQKILTDGDPNGTGVFTEVAYQSFLPDIVKTRQRMVDGLLMAPLQSVRQVFDPATGVLVDANSVNIPYTFDTSGLAPGSQLTVSATLHFRHLPPEFIRALADEQLLLDNITDSARIDDPDALTDNLTITDVVTAETGDGVVLACEGPQNDPDATILDCLEPVDGDEAVEIALPSDHPPLAEGPAEPAVAAITVGGMTALGGFIGRRRRRTA
jgi:cytochrome c553